MRADSEQKIRIQNMVFILKNEFGIKTMEDLQKAFDELKPLDVSMFCAKNGGSK